MNATIRYYGGKGCMYSQIMPFFPKKETYDTYIEPFGGSYGVGLRMHFIPPIEIYNDLDKNVYSLYKVLRDEELFAEFRKRCELCIVDEETRKEQLTLMKNSDLPLVDRAFAFFYVNRTSFNGSGGFSINPLIRNGVSKSVSDMFSAVNGLEQMHNRMSKVVVCNKNGLELIDKYNTENVFIYADPPYVFNTRLSSARYNVEMSDTQHKEFVKLCSKTKAKVLISGYDNALYDVLLENGFHKHIFSVKTIDSKHKKRIKNECLWFNYNTVETEENNLFTIKQLI